MKNHHPDGGTMKPGAQNTLHEAIATRAYELWMRDGGPEDKAESFWLKAEREQATGEPVPRKKAPGTEPALPVSF